MSATRAATVPTAVAPLDRLARASRFVSELVSWKLEQEARAEVRYRQQRRAARRRRRQRADRRHVLLSKLTRGWRR